MKPHVFVVTFSLILFSLPCSVTDASSLSEDEQKVEILLDAVRQALRPVTNMKVQYLFESSSGSGTRKKVGASEQPSIHKQEISVILGGNRSRMERIYKIAKNNEMHVLNTKVSVFDGKRFRLLEEHPDPTGGFKYRGNLALKDNNHGVLIRHLSGLPINIFEPKILAGFTFELQPSSTAGIYILDAIRIKNKVRRSITIDGNRGFNVIKVEGILPNGKINYETNCRLKEYESGIWYPCEYETIRHTKSKPDGSPFIETRMKIKNIKFNIDVNDDMFKLEFPYGTQVFDSCPSEKLYSDGKLKQ